MSERQIRYDNDSASWRGAQIMKPAVPKPQRCAILQGRAVEGGAGEAAVVVVIGDEAPALMRLAFDIGLAGFPLGIKRVEFDQMKQKFTGGADNERPPGSLVRDPRPCRRKRKLPSERINAAWAYVDITGCFCVLH
jgi:hypothetical protein